MVIIYICGYGRSGSMILDLTIGNLSKHFVSLGEIAVLPKRLKYPRLGCSCGDLNYNCNVWADVSDFIRKFSEKKLTRFAKMEQFGAINSKRDIIEYNAFWNSIFDIRCNNNIQLIGVIDSSKSSYKQIFRPFLLNKGDTNRVYLLHIQRSFSSLYSSIKKGSNLELSKGKPNKKRSLRHNGYTYLKTFIHWLYSNYFTMLLCKLYSMKNVIYISFDDFLKDTFNTTKEIIDNIEKMEGVYDNKQKKRVSDIYPHHIVEGNRVSKNVKIKIN